MFVFRFEALLTTRRHTEEIRQRELAEARRNLAAEQAALREQRRRRRRCLLDLQDVRRERFRAPAAGLYGAYLERIEREIDAQQKRIALAERQVADRRAALLEAVQQRKVLEKLREKDHQAHQSAAARRERRFMDEVAARRHAARPVI